MIARLATNATNGVYPRRSSSSMRPMPTRRTSVPAHDDLSTEIGERLAANVRRLRKDKRWTQRQLAEKSETHIRHVQKVEGAECNLTLATITKIADALRVDPSTLLEPVEGTTRKRGAT